MNKLTVSAMMLCATVLGADKTPFVKNIIVYKEPDRFGGWPANNGIWSWGNEIVVGFMQGYFKNTERGHAIDNQKPNVPRFARSTDGGQTWNPLPIALDGSLDKFRDAAGNQGNDYPPNICLAVSPSNQDIVVIAWRGERLFVSTDAGQTWKVAEGAPQHAATILIGIQIFFRAQPPQHRARGMEKLGILATLFGQLHQPAHTDG